MRWLTIVILAGILVSPLLALVLVLPTPVLASTNADILVKATPTYENPGIPQNFALTKVSEYEILITWTKGASANNTMVRAAIGRAPEDRTDGYEVYYGEAENVTDYGVNLDTTADKYYYRAWSEDVDDGDWSSYVEASIGGTGVTLLALVVLATGLTIAMFVTRQMMLGFPCVIFWGVLGGYSYTQSTATWDWQYFLYFASIGMVIFSSMAMYALRTKKEEAKEGDAFIDEGKDDTKFIDEGGSGEPKETEDKPRKRRRDLRDRAAKRRERWE